MTKQAVDPRYDATRAGKWRTGNDGRLHTGLAHKGYWTRPAYFARKQALVNATTN